jgi:hypothetical protein
MRTFAFAALTLALVAATDAAPPVSIDQALKIANGYLQETGRAGQTSIVGITLEKTAITSGKQVWVARWDTPVMLDDTKRETGLEIAMDGSYARYTEKVASKNTPFTVGVPAQRAELSNHRTRSTRPSILDLKH